MDSSPSINNQLNPSLRKFETILIICLLFQTAVGIWCAVQALSQPVSVNDQVVISLSIIKWIILAFGIIASEVTTMWLLAISVFPNHIERVEKTHHTLMARASSLQWITSLLSIVMGIILLLPGSVWGSLELSFIVFRPLLVWLFFADSLIIMVTFFFQSAADFLPLQSDRGKACLGWILSAVTFLFAWYLILTTGIGIGRYQDYLTGPAFFMFFVQIVVSIAVVPLVWRLLKWFGYKQLLVKNILSVLVLISAAVLLWFSYSWVGAEKGGPDLSPIRVSILGLWFLVYLYSTFQSTDFSVKRFWTSLRKDMGWWIGLTVLLVLTGILVAFFGLGTSSGQPYWYGAGVPLLFEQILFCIAIVLIFKEWVGTLTGRFPVFQNHPDLFICIALFLFTALLWALQPQQTSFFTPGPYPPTNTYQPFADSAYYDQQSQTALLGSGLNGGQYLDRPFYPALLTVLHLLGGQNFGTVMALQAVLLALMVLGIYGIGKLLHSRLAGVLTALFVAIQGWNAIFTVISANAASPIQMLTEYPTAVMLVFAVLCYLSALRGSRLRYVWLAVCGVLLGLGSLLRTNVLVVAVCLLVLPFFYLRKLRWSALAISGMILAAFFLSILPWGLRNVSVGADSIFSMYTSKIDHVISQRYNSPGGYTPSADGASDTSAAIGMAADTSAAIGMSTDPSAAIGTCAPTPTSSTETPLSEEGTPTPLLQRLLPSGYRVVNHFFHNLATSAFLFPIDLADSSLQQTFAGNTYWQDGMVITLAHPQDVILLVVNMLIIALGLAVITRKAGLIGWVPLVVFAGYHASNALALVSGGRHLVEVGWVLVFYFAIGLVQLGKLTVNLFKSEISDPEPTQPRVTRKTLTRLQSILVVIAALFGALALGSLVPLTEHLVPNRAVSVNDPRILQDWWNYFSTNESTFDVMPFIVDNPTVVFVEGRVFYPRYFDQGQPIYLDCATLYEPQNLLTFTALGQQQYQVTMPMAEMPALIPSGSAAIMLACPGEGNELRALALLLPDSGVDYLADLDTFHCP